MQKRLELFSPEMAFALEKKELFLEYIEKVLQQQVHKRMNG